MEGEGQKKVAISINIDADERQKGPLAVLTN